MANPMAGEVALSVDGTRHTLKLTLGALAELEARLESDSLADLVARFDGDRIRAADVMLLVHAGLRGGGWTGEFDDLLHADIAGGPVEAARVAARLLSVAFMVPT